MPLKTHIDEQPTLNLTPMIDITFLIVIFFLVGTQFKDVESQIGVNVPQVGHAEAKTAAPEKRIVNVDRRGLITLDQQVVTLEQLTARLAAARGQYADLGVIVRGDAQGEFQNVASALSAVRAAGISDMGIAVRLIENEP